MAKTITINGKEYALKEITFKALTELEKLGFNLKTLQDVEGNYFGSIMSLSAFVMGVTLNEASKQIDAHIANGGQLDDFSPLFEMISESDFFRNLSKQQSVEA